MKNRERFIWTLTTVNVLALCAFVCGYSYHSRSEETERLNFLIKTYDAETDILEAQLTDTLGEIDKRASTSYQEGFEAGRTQAGIAFLYDGALQSYGDGYHAALSQWAVQDPMTVTMSDDQAMDLLLDIISRDNTNEREEDDIEINQ